MTEKKQGRVVSVLIALCKATAYLALFLGCQSAVVSIYMTAVGAQLALEGVIDSDALFDALYERTMAAATALTLLSGLLTLAIILLFYLVRRKKLGDALWLRRVEKPTLLTGVAMAPALYFIVAIVLAMLPDQMMENYTEASANLDDASFVAFLSVVIVAPIVEEVVFRGLIMTRLAKVVPSWLAVAGSAAIFGICHGEFVWFCYAFLLGFVFGLMDMHAGSILPSILGHMAFNFIGQMFTMLNTWFPEGGWEVTAMLLLLALAVFLPILDRKAINAIFRPMPRMVGIPSPGHAAVHMASVQPQQAEVWYSGDSTFSYQDEFFVRDLWSEE